MKIENGSGTTSPALTLSRATSLYRNGRSRGSEPALQQRSAGMSPRAQALALAGHVVRSVRHTPVEDPLPPNDFLRQLEHEKRRAERSRAALSIVIYRVDAMQPGAALLASKLVEMLHRTKRETDLLGLVGDDVIAVLCPDTGQEGTAAFLAKLQARPEAAGLPFKPVVATYPDLVFDILVTGDRSLPEVDPLFLADAPGTVRPGYRAKRLLDVVGAFVALCLLSPLMLSVAAVIALTSPGRVIFRQIRLGQGGVPFVFYKFRSMVSGADDGIHREFVARLIRGEHREAPPGEGGTPLYKMSGDPRVTRIGRLIRKTSIDELPQLFNVLKGDMSLTGPRPPIPYEAANYQAWHLRRVLSVRPGITGMWQVDGRSKVSFDEMVRMDLRYIRQCSLWLDLRILLKTVLVVLRCDGAN